MMMMMRGGGYLNKSNEAIYKRSKRVDSNGFFAFLPSPLVVGIPWRCPLTGQPLDPVSGYHGSRQYVSVETLSSACCSSRKHHHHRHPLKSLYPKSSAGSRRRATTNLGLLGRRPAYILALPTAQISGFALVAYTRVYKTLITGAEIELNLVHAWWTGRDAFCVRWCHRD